MFFLTVEKMETVNSLKHLVEKELVEPSVWDYIGRYDHEISHVLIILGLTYLFLPAKMKSKFYNIFRKGQ